MKIVFWSPVHGQAGMTSNFLMITLLAGMMFKKNCLITQTHFNFNNLEAPLIESNTKDTSDYFLDVGIDALIRNFKAQKLEQEIVENCCISLSGTNISLLPGTTKTNRESFEYEIGMIAPRLIKAIETYYDVIFIDASPAFNALSSKLMEEADLVVINLSQNLGIADVFFSTYMKNINAKLFYLFGTYDSNSKYNIANIRRKYKTINSANSGAIPYNTGYKDAQIESKVIDFIKKNMNCSKDNESAYFMMKSISAAEKILKTAGVKI